MNWNSFLSSLVPFLFDKDYKLNKVFWDEFETYLEKYKSKDLKDLIKFNKDMIFTIDYDCDKGKEIVFPSVMSVLQDLGYSIKTGDKNTGLITAESTAKSNMAMKIWLGIIY